MAQGTARPINLYGSNGKSVLNGAGAPSNGLGVDGDFYLRDPATAPQMYGPKAAGAWPGSGTNLIGIQGIQGEKGWSPILAVVTDSERRVLQIVDWTGGAGTKPSTTNQFIGAAGIVGSAAAAVDIRGAVGPPVSDGDKGDVTVSGSGATWRLSGTPRSVGAVGDGTANDRLAFVTLDSALPTNYGISLGSGRYRIGSDLTITRPLDFSSGARIVVPTGVTVTINAPLKAGIEQIFELEGTGVVVCSSYYVQTRYVEWWGGVVGADTTPALAQALKSGTVTLMQARDYVTSATISIPAFATLQGAGCNYEGDNTATRVLLASASVTPIVQLGSTTGSPPDINSAPYAPQALDIYFGRNTNPNANTVSVAVGWSRSARLIRVRATNSIKGFQFKNTVSAFVDDCFAKRDVAIAGGQGADSWIAYHIDSTGTLPAAGGNASLWITRPQAELNVAISGAAAFKLEGRISDVFITQPETVGHAYGLDVQGDRAGSPVVGSNANVTIENPVFDQSTTAAIRVRDINKWGALQIIEPYCGPATGDGIIGQNNEGSFAVLGGQLRMNVATGGSGVIFDTCRNPVLQSTSIAECTLAAVKLTAITGGIIQPLVQNNTATCAAAVQSVATVTNTTIRPSINGTASKVTAGHKSDATSNANNVISLVGATPAVLVAKTTYVTGAELGSTFPESDVTIGRKTANQAFTGAAANVTDMAVALEANSTYKIDVLINVGAVTGTGPTMNLGFTGPASPTSVMMKRRQMTSTVLEGAVGVVTSFTTFGALAQVANTMHEITGTVSNGATAGTLQLQITMAGTTPNATVLAGSSITATRIAVTP